MSCGDFSWVGNEDSPRSNLHPVGVVIVGAVVNNNTCISDRSVFGDVSYPIVVQKYDGVRTRNVAITLG